MKEIRTRGGALPKRPFYEKYEIEQMCISELKNVGVLPSEPAPIRIEQFIETRFSLTPDYEELPAGMLGYTRFGSSGAERIVVSRSLAEDGTESARRRLRTTFAHEAGHALLHSHLFVTPRNLQALFNEEHKSVPKVLCRDVVDSGVQRGYGGEWWEFQANQAMGSLLLPETLFREAVETARARLVEGKMTLLDDEGDSYIVSALSDIFDVNPAVVRYRYAEIYRS